MSIDSDAQGRSDYQQNERSDQNETKYPRKTNDS
jgi:hypothetical protein